MMDLVDIRKKAKTRRQPKEEPTAEGTRASVRSTCTIQGAPVDRLLPPVPLPEEDRPAPSSPLPDEDPLDALFSFQPDIALATEEGYLQTLRGGDEAEKNVDLCEWLTFSLGNEEYALDIAGVSEIIKPREVTEIPRVPDFILGIISLRGIIIPVFDLKRRLKLGADELTPTSRIIVCQKDDRSAGLLVDGITQVVRIPAGLIEPPPAILTGLDRELVDGVGRYQGRMLILLDLSSVLNTELI